MFTAVTLFAVATFAALVLRRLKQDMTQEKEFRAKLSNIPSGFLHQS